MLQRAPAIDDDIIEAVREDEIESMIAEARERQATCDDCDWPPAGNYSTALQQEHE